MWLASEKCWDPSKATRKERGEEKACFEQEQTWRWGGGETRRKKERKRDKRRKEERKHTRAVLQIDLKRNIFYI